MVSSETFKAVSRYLGLVGAILFPGVFTLDVMFHKGLFSGSVQTLYDFILLIIWAVGLSVPYVAIPVGMFSLDPDIREATEDDKDKEKAEAAEASIYYFVFPQAMVFAFAHFVLYRVLLAYWTTFPDQLAGFSRIRCFAVLSLLLVVLLQYPVTKCYIRFLRQISTE